MLKKEARIITGGLSKPNKMPGPSINLPAVACITGAKLVNVKGSTCSGCYALKGRYRFPNVRDAMQRRLDRLYDPRWIEAMVTLIDQEPVFRWQDSGDIQSVEHLRKIFEVCRLTPGTKHWLPTQERQYLLAVSPVEVPDNLIIRLSGSKIDGPEPSCWPHTSTVVTKSASCPAPSQGGKCKECRACWTKSISNVSYGKH